MPYQVLLGSEFDYILNWRTQRRFDYDREYKRNHDCSINLLLHCLCMPPDRCEREIKRRERRLVRFFFSAQAYVDIYPKKKKKKKKEYKWSRMYGIF
jgi:hypothetical protein